MLSLQSAKKRNPARSKTVKNLTLWRQQLWHVEYLAPQQSIIMLEIKHKDDGKKGEFYISDHRHHFAEMTYTWVGDSILIIDHTLVDDTLRRQGIDLWCSWPEKNRSKLFHSVLLQNPFLIEI